MKTKLEKVTLHKRVRTLEMPLEIVLAMIADTHCLPNEASPVWLAYGKRVGLSTTIFARPGRTYARINRINFPGLPSEDDHSPGIIKLSSCDMDFRN